MLVLVFVFVVAATVTTAYCYVGKFLGSLSDVWSPNRGQNASGRPSAQSPNTGVLFLVVVVISTVAIAVFAARCLSLPYPQSSLLETRVHPSCLLQTLSVCLLLYDNTSSQPRQSVLSD